ncbi:MAG: polysaccharide deacetylase family protein [Rhizobiaceae bacterium]|nr:polysaccharide deacetylase family protein [Rhizobiaceae bacterium]
MGAFRDIFRQIRYAGIRTGLEAASLIPRNLQFGAWSGRGVIFTLHHVRPHVTAPFQPNALLSITPDFLDSAIRAVLDCGLKPARLEELPDLLQSSDDQRYFCMTLDDGYRNNAEYAAPIFRRYAVPYTIFITGGFVERSRAAWWELAEAMLLRSDEIALDTGGGERVFQIASPNTKAALFDRIAAYVNEVDEDVAVAGIVDAAERAGLDPQRLTHELCMDCDELRALADSDDLVSFGAHTVSHCNLKRVDDDRLEWEVQASVDAVTDYTGRVPQSFAYPYGWKSAAGSREAQAVKSAGLKVGVTTQPGVLRDRDASDCYLLPRVSLNGHFQHPRYVRAMASGIPFLLT